MYASSSHPSLPVAAEVASALADLDVVLSPALTLAEARAYDQFVATAPSGHYSQSRAWAAVATAGKPFEPYWFLARRGDKVVGAAQLLRTRLGVLPLPLAQIERGPVTAAPEDLPVVLTALRHACLAKGIARLSLMPYWTGDARRIAERHLRQAGFSDCQRFAGRHGLTLRLDLTALDQKNPFNSSGLSKVRQNIGRAQRAGATSRPGRREDLAGFAAMQAALLAQENKAPPPPAWYAAMGDFFLAPGQAMFVCEFEGDLVSAIFITLHKDIATYALGASSGRPLRFSKTVLPMADAILWARAQGAKLFDMGGVPLPGDPDAKRTSIAEFKYSYSRLEVPLVHEHRRWF